MRCKRKLSFSTVEQAERTAAAVATVRGTFLAPVRIYECSDCGRLHFTSSPRRYGAPTDTTVKVLGPVTPLFVEPSKPTVAPRPPKVKPAPVDPCAKCGEGAAKFEFRGLLYHRRCRLEVIRALPCDEQRAALDALARAGQAEGLAAQRNMARTGQDAPLKVGEG